MLKQVSLGIVAPNPLQEVARQDKAEVNVLDCRNLNGRRVMMLLDVSAPEDEIGHVVYDLRVLSNVEKLYSTKETPDGALCVAVLQRHPICQVANECGVLCLRCPFNSVDEELRWDVLLKDQSDLRRLLDRLELSGMHARVKGITETRRDSLLTHRQQEVIGKAIALGYFEFPRKIDLTQLAQLLQIKPSSLSEILRNAQRKILTRYADEMTAQPN